MPVVVLTAAVRMDAGGKTMGSRIPTEKTGMLLGSSFSLGTGVAWGGGGIQS